MLHTCVSSLVSLICDSTDNPWRYILFSELLELLLESFRLLLQTLLDVDSSREDLPGLVILNTGDNRNSGDLKITT